MEDDKEDQDDQYKPMFQVEVDDVTYGVWFRHQRGNTMSFANKYGQKETVFGGVTDDSGALRRAHTICNIAVSNSTEGLTGDCYCSVNDQFSFRTGRKLALTQAVAALPQRVRCAIWDKYREMTKNRF
jgi:hypothetical protein